MRRTAWLACSACLAAAVLVACGGEQPSPMPAAPVRVVEAWSLSAEAVLEIGVLSGAPPYQLHDVGSSVLLPDERVAVVNGGSGQIRIFDGEGGFVRQFGAEGEGPGEFLLATHVQWSEGTLKVWDQRLRRFATFDTLGTLLEMESLQADASEPYPLDVWLYGRNLVNSPVEPGARGALAAGISALPPVDTTMVFRYVRVTEEGHMWAAWSVPPTEAELEWEVYDLDGSLRARVRTPARFRPHQIGSDFVLGLWLDDLDVNYVRLYDLLRPEGSVPGPGLDVLRQSGTPLPPAPPRALPGDVLPLMKSQMKFLASVQMIHYSQQRTHTMDVSQLDLEIPEDIRVDFIEAHARGFTGVVTHRPTGAFCVMTYGFTVPMGWSNGMVVCPGT